MASDLLSIARSGAEAARVALDVTAHNIANAGTQGYVRRSARLAEVSSTGGIGSVGDVSVSGVRLDRIVRNADLFRQSEVRRTGSDAARAAAEVTGLENVESAVEQARVYPAVVEFEGGLQQLLGDPTDSSLRAGVIEAARTMTRSFNIAAGALASAGAGLRFEAADEVGEVGLLAQELARVNLRLARAADASSDKSALLDQRDVLLQRMSESVDVTTSFAADDTVTVRLGGAAGELLVQGGGTAAFAMATAADGTIAFSVNGAGVALSGGSLAGKSLALTRLAGVEAGLDAIAASLIDTANTAQAGGVALDGSGGQPLFGGVDAAGMTLALTSGAQLATAPAGAPAGSRDPGNLDSLRAALAAANPAGQADALLFAISGAVAGRKVTRDALDTIAGSARVSLESQAGVDLDQEAVNLVRYQQAFQASGRAMQVATDIFDTLLGIR